MSFIVLIEKDPANRTPVPVRDMEAAYAYVRSGFKVYTQDGEPIIEPTPLPEDPFPPIDEPPPEEQPPV